MPPSSPRVFAAWCFGLLVALGAGIGRAGQEGFANPNVVLIVADDLGYGDLSCYGQPRLATPFVDRLAAEGMKFTNFYAGSTVCAPSRCVLMTGLHTGHCFIRGNSTQNLRAGDVTIAEMLQRNGYQCGLFGKWGLGHEDSGGLPTRQGFHEFYGYLDQRHAHNYYPSFLIRNTRREPLTNVVPEETPEGAGVASVREQYAPDLITAEALSFLDSHRNEAFFLYYAPTLPHANNEAGARGLEVPDLGRFAEKDWPESEKAYAAMIARLDADVGRILAKLSELGIDDRTVVLFTSDNGPHKEGGHNPEAFDSNGPLRGIKRDLYDGGIRVPMLVRWPGHLQPGTVSDHWAYHGDVFATVCELTGVKPLEGLDSVSFAPTLLGRPEDQDLHSYLYWEFHERGFSQAVRHGEWKAVRRGGPGERVELFNLVDDPGEAADLAESESNTARQMAAFMDDAHVPSREWPVKTDEPARPARDSKSRAREKK